ncbi:MAG: YHS domain-containing protein [Patescibacteria group bacterium]|nr:YHS domain-containing protein [Actinomycetota bacterium]MCL5438897.1 YHS domain-containing protein [Patescibacteria group bacterium]
MFGFSKKVTDPVCKMKVDKNKTKYSSEYKGEKYYFCSEDCLKKFDTEPKKYLVQDENISTQNCCHQNSKSCC